MSEETYWQQGDQRAYSPLRGRRTADAVVVGGGLTGLTVALWLCRAGLRVVLLEANTLGSGSTACCLGRVSLLGGVSLSRLEKRFGQEWASAYRDEPVVVTGLTTAFDNAVGIFWAAAGQCT